MSNLERLRRRSNRLTRPPVRAATFVRSGAAHTFDAFVRTMGAWWPAQPISAGKDRVRDITVEPRLGGRVFEKWDDGTVVEWGEIIRWTPPAGFSMSWRGTPEPTEVEFGFAELGPNLTRVTVEHRGWEALTDEQLGADCALPGGYASGAYSQGWDLVLAAFAAAIPPDTPAGPPA
jgi:hypothetical protein